VLADDPDYRHTTVLGERPDAIYTVEHLLAALAGIGIVDVTVVVDDSGHVPFFDGSCAVFVEAILRAGIIAFACDDQRTIRIVKPLYVGESWAWLRPSPHDTLSIDARIEFPEPIRTQQLHYVHDPRTFHQVLAPARTFMSTPWDGRVIASCPGFTYDPLRPSTTSMLTHNGAHFHLPLRMSDECVRHKVVDMIGDLTVLGQPLAAAIQTFRPGHALSRKILRTISQVLAVAEPVAVSGP
jgi:UDP-3-O-[3-hydroxymyristoyl] N-acetylglucosamine deacetylase